MESNGKKTLGQAIDEIVGALKALDEPSRTVAVRAACELLGLPNVPFTATARSESAKRETAAHADAIPSDQMHAVHDIRTFRTQKEPGSAMEMACLVAYYLDTLAPTAEHKKDVNAADLEKYFKQGGYPLPKRMPQILVDARAAGYFDSVGHGKYKLNPVGHNLVVHKLPKKKSK